MASEKAAAYYYHGLILDEGSEENAQAKAVACFHAAEQFLKESKTACINFCLAAPVTRVPPVWGAMKYLSEKIQRDASSKSLTNGSVQKLLEGVPKLPDFPVALKPDEYEMPPIDPSWTIKVGMGLTLTPNLGTNVGSYSAGYDGSGLGSNYVSNGLGANQSSENIAGSKGHVAVIR